MIHRRAMITGLVSLIAAPAIVRAGSLMPVKAMKTDRDLFPIWVRMPDGPITPADFYYRFYAPDGTYLGTVIDDDSTSDLRILRRGQPLPITTPRQILT